MVEAQNIILHNFFFSRIQFFESKQLLSLFENLVTSFPIGWSTGTFKFAFLLSSWNASTRLWSFATNSIKSDVNVAKDKELALSYILDSCWFSNASTINERCGHDDFWSILSEELNLACKSPCPCLDSEPELLVTYRFVYICTYRLAP